jgi:hypothetical protein
MRGCAGALTRRARLRIPATAQNPPIRFWRFLLTRMMNFLRVRYGRATRERVRRFTWSLRPAGPLVGVSGKPPRVISRDELARWYDEEARCSCRELGIEPPIILDFGDGQLGRILQPPWANVSKLQGTG